MTTGGLKQTLKHLAMRAMRPGLVDLNDRLGLLEDQVRALGASEKGGSWRGGLDGVGLDQLGRGSPSLTSKFRDELTFWEGVVKRDSVKLYGGPFEQVYGGWQRARIDELRQFLGLPDHGAMRGWCAERSAVEIGAGPYPSIATVRWKRAVAIDPLADGYAAEGLLPKDCFCDEVVYLSSPGEAVPLPSGFADLVVIENALDHVDDPGAVVREIHRLLKPGGHLWILVDLMTYSDHMHPNPFTEDSLRRLLAPSGFTVVKDRVSDHKSHPQAYGEYRGLLVKPVEKYAVEIKPTPSPLSVP